ncbi:unnamed protein product [Arctia plantaginis]|uniref:FP protein C-terminal domain-containing protein n=1 Tax=Arctia plantaginis TaxID=874455 RepID=A0A8S1BB87_ARCPL|nr:unnamed protein product [Arctia plantaginis]
MPSPVTRTGADLCESDSSETEPVRELSLFLKELRATRIEMSNLRSSLIDLTGAVQKSNERMDSLEIRINDLEGKINNEDRADIRNMERQIDQLKLDLQEREQELLSNDVEIAGIPETPGEGINHIVLSVAAKLGVQLEERDIVDAVRVGVPRASVEGEPGPRPRNIAVRVSRRSNRDALLKAARVRRGATTAGMGLIGAPRKFYVNERLKKLNRQLFGKAREFAERLKWRFVWTREGKIYVRKDNGSTRHRLRSDSDLSGVFGDCFVGAKS